MGRFKVGILPKMISKKKLGVHFTLDNIRKIISKLD